MQDYSKKELKTLKSMYEGYYPMEMIAKKLGRETHTVITKVHRLGWAKRDRHLIKMINFHGRNLLKFGPEPAQIRLALKLRREEERLSFINERDLRRQKALKGLNEAIAKGGDRNSAIRVAYAEGATLSQIGHALKLTKQAIGLIVRNVSGGR